MHRILTALLCFAMGLNIASAKRIADTNSDVLHVGSFNVWGDKQRNNVIKKGNAPQLRSWANGRDAVAQMIVDANWDIFGVQEACPTVRKELPQLVKRNGGRYKWWFALPGEYDPAKPSKHLANGIVYRKSRFKMLDTDISWISDTPTRSSYNKGDKIHKRVIGSALMRDKRTGKLFIFTATHGPLRCADSAENAQIIIDRIRLFNKDQLPTILVGDMNAQPHSAFSARLRTAFDDTQDIATRKSEVRGTVNGSRPLEGVPGPRCIDYIYVGSADGSHSVSEHNVFINRYEIGGKMFYPSDHCPIGAHITFK
ncbi:MAG: endonuclease/exonuclease/phosphatase family protein [Alistipes sp.]|nr:endonuclease/exonuclease/phosphatase family protein [Alistipes sp.]